MKFTAVVIAVLTVGGCSRTPRTPVSSAQEGGGQPATAMPAQFSDLAPGDTAGVIAMMRGIMQGIDTQLGGLQERDTVLAAVADSQPRRLTVWVQDSVPRKLVVSDSGGNGPGAGETDVWFMGGDVSVIEETDDIYALDFGAIVLWTDSSFQPRTDVDRDMFMARQTLLIDRVRNWLAVLGLTFPD